MMLQEPRPELFTPAGEMVLRFIFAGAVLVLIAIVAVSLRKRRNANPRTDREIRDQGPETRE